MSSGVQKATCKTCGKEARVGTLEELRKAGKSSLCALIEREIGEGKREPLTYRCAHQPAKSEPEKVDPPTTTPSQPEG